MLSRAKNSLGKTQIPNVEFQTKPWWTMGN